jgi:hypothetical protein
VTGPQNRWPDSWTALQRDTAIALARLHLRFTTQPSPYAERLLAAALRADSSEPDSTGFPAWQSTARMLLVEALAGNGKTVEAQTLAKQAASGPVEALLETVIALDGQLTRDSRFESGDRALGELVFFMVRLVDSRRSELDAASIARLGVCRASALAAIGDRPAAHAQFAALAARSPDDGELHERYATFLMASDSQRDLRDALDRWQQVESRSRRGGPRWRRARAARIDLLARLGQHAEADKLTRLTQLLYPDWNKAVNLQ